MVVVASSGADSFITEREEEKQHHWAVFRRDSARATRSSAMNFSQRLQIFGANGSENWTQLSACCWAHAEMNPSLIAASKVSRQCLSTVSADRNLRSFRAAESLFDAAHPPVL